MEYEINPAVNQKIHLPNGAVYELKSASSLTRKELRKIAVLEQSIPSQGETVEASKAIESVFEAVRLVTNIPDEALDDVTMGMATQILDHFKEQMKPPTDSKN